MVGNSSIITEDLSCPFVLGAHYNGEAKSGYHNADNRVKAIHTKSGHKLIFTEDESILLTDKNGNVIKLDTQGKNIEISAPAPLLRLKVLLEFTLISTSELTSIF